MSRSRLEMIKIEFDASARNKNSLIMLKSLVRYHASIFE